MSVNIKQLDGSLKAIAGQAVNIDVIDNLTSDSTTDALSAKQGKVLKGLVDGKADTSSVPTKLSQLEEDINHKTVTNAERGLIHTSYDVHTQKSGVDNDVYSETTWYSAYDATLKCAIKETYFNLKLNADLKSRIPTQTKIDQWDSKANTWYGTTAEYEAQKSQIADGTEVIITDDYISNTQINQIQSQVTTNTGNISTNTSNITSLKESLTHQADLGFLSRNVVDITSGYSKSTDCTCSADGVITYTNDNYKGWRIEPNLIGGNKYTLSFDLVITSGTAFIGGNGLPQTFKTASGHYSITFTASSSSTEIAFCGASATSSGNFSNVMFEEGEVAHDYVSYALGNTDLTKQMESATNEGFISRNLLPSELNKIVPCKLRVGDKLTFSASGLSSTNEVTFWQCDANGTRIEYWNVKESTNPNNKIVISSNSDYVVLKFNNSNATNIMLNRGTEALPYETYAPSNTSLMESLSQLNNVESHIIGASESLSSAFTNRANRATYIKCGNTTILNLNFTFNNDASVADYQICVLPVGYRPTVNVWSATTLTFKGFRCLAFVDTNGVVKITLGQATTSGDWFSAQMILV